MVKHALVFIAVFYLMITSVFALSEDDRWIAKLRSEYGQDLTKAPFFLQFDYSKKYGRDWKKTFFIDRKEFLKDYDINYAKEQAKEKARARLEAEEEHQRLMQERDEKRRKAELLKARLAQQKAEQKDEDDRQKAFDSTIKDQKLRLQQLMRQVTQNQ